MLAACSSETVPPQPTASMVVTMAPTAPTETSAPIPSSIPFRYVTLRPYSPLPTPTHTPSESRILAFFNTYNAGQFDQALALLDENIGVSDCDYQTIKNMGFAGKSEVTLWLRQRIADHDHLSVNGVFGGSAIEPTAFGVDFSRRTSDTLRRIGFPNGIRN